MSAGMAASIAVLRDAYPRQDFPDRSVTLYAKALSDLNPALVMAAVERLVRRSTWLPSIAEIRMEVAEALVGLPSGDEAWEAVTSKQAWELPPEVAQTVDDVGGWWAIRTSSRPETMRAQFLSTYERRRAQAVLAAIGAATPRKALTARETVRALPESTRIRPRPCVERMMRRWAGSQVGAPSSEEMHDAILLLKDGPTEGLDPLYEEAQRVLDDADAATTNRLAGTDNIG